MTVLDNPPPPTASEPEGSDNSGKPIGSLLFFGMAGLLIALVASVAVIGVVGLFQDDNDGGGDGGSASAFSSVDVSLTEFSIGGNLTAVAGDVSLDVVNDGSIEHNLVARESGDKTPLLAAGESATLVLGSLAPGSYELFCDVPGHAESGMLTDLVVVGSGEGGGEASGAEEGEEEIDGAAMDKIMVDSMLAFPAETEGIGNEVLEYEMVDGFKQFELTAAITPWEVSPGEFVDAWTYNGMVPGPQIKVDLGDKVRVIITNETPLGTDIHWHGVHTPNSEDGVSPFTQDPISSGDTYTYEFEATDPAIGMYHAHLHSQISVINGMFAAFTIGDKPIPRGETISGVTIPADLVLDKEMPMVLNDAGVIGLTLNGKSFPATEPLVLEPGAWVGIDYYNEGLTAHPMHMHQFPQLVYAKDGIALDHPYWADTINVAPGERYSVIVHAEDPGVWVWHCHILTHVERETGMFGMVTAVIVQEAEG
ncbi:MAG: multicopper oxidase domain-containing protein [Actinobacteria bacterium]|nr:multicopper oxidase domain-containing protein [Actinomycetota bacterium]